MSDGEITGAMARLGIGRAEAATVDYLGDGVYATHDGHQIWLRTLEGHKIALEPQVAAALDSYRLKCELAAIEREAAAREKRDGD